MWTRAGRLVAVGVIVAGLAACGDDGDDASDALDDLGLDAGDIGSDEDAEEFDDAVADALGAGGGGTLTFDGEEIEIDSAVCMLDGDLFDVGTVSENNFRVFVSQTNPQNPLSIQILDADGVQWFPDGDAPLDRDGGTFTSSEATYFNNADDRTVEASFTVECPD